MAVPQGLRHRWQTTKGHSKHPNFHHGRKLQFKHHIAKFIDKCYVNVKHAYTAIAKPPLFNCNHNAVQGIQPCRAVHLVKSFNAWTRQ